MSPLLQGSISLRQFYVEGERGRDWERAADASLRRHAFRPIGVEKGETRSAGWVNPRQVLDADIRLDNLRVGPWLVLALRLDRVAVNPRLYRARRDLALAEAAAKAKKARLSKNERQIIEEKVKMEMLRVQTPSTQIVEALWAPDKGVAYVGAASEAAAQVFSEVFAATFDLSLVPAMAAVRAMRWAEREGVEDRLAELAPSFFGHLPGEHRPAKADSRDEEDDNGPA